jgi:enamine deaminase RidA (YjgF/YER057c/UK114 family)
MSVPIKRQQSDERLSKIVEYGNLVFIAGTVADNRGPTDSLKAQTEEVLRKIDGLLAAAGTNKSRLLSANVWISDIREKDQMDTAWKAWVDPENKPARACQQTGLATPDTRVEIMVIAAKP